jgi:peptide/nickel transport system permease protein
MTGIAGRGPRVLRLRSARLATGVLLVVVFLTAFGPFLAPVDPLHQDVANLLQGPSGKHLLGTDYLGRDVLSRLIAGTRDSVLSALEAVVVGLVLGTVPGIAAVFFGRRFDWITNRISDALMTLPPIVFAIAVTAVLGNSLFPAMVAIGVLISPLFFRVTRAASLEYASAQYVEAATLQGASRARVVRVHVLPKLWPTVAVTAASAAASAVLTVSSLTFLGLGVQPPNPTWGGVMSSDLNYLTQTPWAPVAPALLIIVTVAALNALADAVRDTTGAGSLVLDDLAPDIDDVTNDSEREVRHVDQHAAA